jgi:hypothetical protein
MIEQTYFEILFRNSNNPINLDVSDIKNINLMDEYHQVGDKVLASEVGTLSDICKMALDPKFSGTRPIQEYDMINLRNNQNIMATLIVLDIKNATSKILKREVNVIFEEGDIYGLYSIPIIVNPFFNISDLLPTKPKNTNPKIVSESSAELGKNAEKKFDRYDYARVFFKKDEAYPDSRNPNDYECVNSYIPLCEWDRLVQLILLTFDSKLSQRRKLQASDIIMHSSHGKAPMFYQILNNTIPFYDERMFERTIEESKYLLLPITFDNWQIKAFCENK